MADKELTRDEQRAKDRQDELDRQAAQEKAMQAFYAETRKEAEKNAADPHRAERLEAERLAEVDKGLNASIKAHDALMAKTAKENKA